MPELPEVETVRRALAPVMEGRRVARVRLARNDLRWPFPPALGARLTGRGVLRLRRRSKYILIDLDDDETWLLHLGMAGRILISGDPAGRFLRDHPPTGRHDHVLWEMDDGTRITFNDPRRFGAIDLFPTGAEASHRLLAHLGPEPLGNGFGGPALAARLRGRRAPVKTVLLDQRVVAGLGNIYVCEALFRARIAPWRPAGRIGAARVEALAGAIRSVLEEAIAAGGSSLRDYRQADGAPGYFQHGFDVYGRVGEPCRRAGCTGTIARVIQAGRSTFHCPRCQR